MHVNPRRAAASTRLDGGGKAATVPNALNTVVGRRWHLATRVYRTFQRVYLTGQPSDQ